MKLKAWRPGVEPACLGRGAGVPHAKLLVQTLCVCRMAAPRQEENRSCASTEGVSGKGDGGGSHHRVLREVSRKGWPHGDTDHSENGVGNPRSSLMCQYCPHYACVLGPGLQSLKDGLPGGSGSDSHCETCGEAPSVLRQRAQWLPIRGALPYFQNCCSEAVEIRMLIMIKPIQSQLLFCFKNL